MIPSSEINNDPKLEKLCKQRIGGNTKFPPFMIDKGLVDRLRVSAPEATFVYEAFPGDLVECARNAGTGKFGPVMSTPVDAYAIRPPEAGPGIRDEHDQQTVSNICFRAAFAKENRSGFDHSEHWAALQVDIPTSPGRRPEPRVDGVEPTQYDIRVDGTLFYKTSGPDLTAVNFRCLLNPRWQIKAVQLGFYDRSFTGIDR